MTSELCPPQQQQQQAVKHWDDPNLVDLPNDLIARNDLLDLINNIIGEDMPPVNPEKPYVVINEQPQSKALRFRYECEGRSAGSIPGVHSTPEQKTFPSIEVHGYKGRAVVVVSCVTKDPPYRPHPHNLVGKEGCKKGVCTVEINSSSMSYTFSNLGIQCVKKKDIEEALRLREEIRVDPFKTGYSHSKQPATIDLNAVRLCFQVFLEGQQRGRFTDPLQPIVSDIIYDKKAMSDLVICKLSDVAASVAGGKEIILLCEKVAKEDISVRFYEEKHGKIVWEDNGEFQHSNVHKQVAISFKTPRYRTLDVETSVKVNIQLKRPSDGATSEPLPFELFPLDSANPKRKRPKLNTWEAQEHNMSDAARGNYYAHMMNVPGDAIKTEPKESPTHPFLGYQGAYRNPNESPSPAEQSPIAHHGSTTPVGPTSPYGGGAHSVTPTPAGYIPGQGAEFLPYPNQYNFGPITASGGNNLQVFHHQPTQQQQQLHGQNQFQLSNNLNNLNSSNTNRFNPSVLPDSLAQPGPSGIGGPTLQNTIQLGSNTGEINISSLLESACGVDFNMNSSELRKYITDLADSAAVKQESLNMNQHRMHQEEENLSNSFTRLTTNVLNDFNKPN